MIDTAFAQLEPMVSIKGACLALGRSRATLYRSRRPSQPREPRPRPVPHNALAAGEQATILGALHQARFLDRAPAAVYAVLLDEGTYLGSASTMYRVLRANNEVRERRALATHPPRTIPELVASAPNKVWSYDSTHLRGPARGVWYFLFAMLDIFSRYVPGHIVLPAEEGEVVRDWIDGLVRVAGPINANSLTIHADNGGPMISKPVSGLLADLHIERSHSRPHVSNDNPYSEAGFKTLKYCPSFPKRFGSPQHARAFCAGFFDFYNHEHRPSGIGYHTPASVHFGTAAEIRAGRALVLASAYAAHPERFVNGAPTPPLLPGSAWINKPKEEPAQIIR